MAWQTPKTNWTGVDGVRDSDLNRIEGNILALRNDNARADITVYVNASSGNDSAGNGSSSSPYQTITKALNSVPRNLNGKDVLISIAGGTYPEAVTIKGFDAPIMLKSNGRVTVNSLRIDGCHCSLNGLLLSTANTVYVVNCGTLTGSGSISIDGAYLNVNYGSIVAIDGIECNDSPGFAIVADNGSRVFAMQITGLNNVNGISSQGGSVVAFGDRTLEFTGVAFFTAMGGRIYGSSQSNAPEY